MWDTCRGRWSHPSAASCKTEIMCKNGLLSPELFLVSFWRNASINDEWSSPYRVLVVYQAKQHQSDLHQLDLQKGHKGVIQRELENCKNWEKEMAQCHTAVHFCFNSSHHAHEEISIWIPEESCDGDLMSETDEIMSWLVQRPWIFTLLAQMGEMSTSYPHPGQNRACLQVWSILAV